MSAFTSPPPHILLLAKCALRGKRRGFFFVYRSLFVPDGVTSSQANPLGNGAVLLLGLGQLLLGAERLVALYVRRKKVQLAISSFVNCHHN